ncbi:MAG: DUF1538 domain-containing protein [Chloroflexi bacterium]|nr:DUF1538 domain-containing protein [Chloroflexota bacterium]
MNQIEVFQGIAQVFLGSTKVFVPLLLIFLAFQFLFLRLPRQYVFNLLTGMALALVGLVLFLQGVKIGFLPAGKAMGEALGALEHKWLIIPFGFFMGFLATFSEPAVRILSNQVEDSSAGSIRKNFVTSTIALGVAFFVALGMVKIVYGIPLMYILAPCYLVALIIMWFCDRAFVSIAFDAGGVATGPMAVTFLMATAVGIASAMEGRDPILDGFGLIALIAPPPILSVMLLGIAFRNKLRKRE